MSQIAVSGVRFAVGTGDTAYPSGTQTNYGDLVETGPSVSTVFGPQFWTKAGASIPTSARSETTASTAPSCPSGRRPTLSSAHRAATSPRTTAA